MGNSVPDAASVLSAGHQRMLERKASRVHANRNRALLIRVSLVAVGLFVLVAGANALLLAVLK